MNAPFCVKAPIILGATTLLILLGGFGGWAGFTQIASAIVTTGKIEVDQNRQVVQHPDGGVVTEILVSEGDLVAKDQVLIRLDPFELRSQLAITEGQLFELIARRGRLEAEQHARTEITFAPELIQAAARSADIHKMMEGQISLLNARTASLAKEVALLVERKAQIRNQIDGTHAQRAAIEQQLTLIDEELTSQKSLLERGLAKASQVLSLRREQARLSGQVAELIAHAAQSEGRITEIEIEILKIATRRREEALTQLRDLQYRELGLAEQRRALRLHLSRLDLRAPVSGVVLGMQVFAERSVLHPADPVMHLVPQNRPLVITTQVETIHIDQVFPNQKVILRFPALDQRITPELFGTVTQVSPDTFTDNATGAAFYRAEINLDVGQIDLLPKGVTLVPGMPVEAFIRTANRTPIAYLVKPLTDYFAKAFREG